MKTYHIHKLFQVTSHVGIHYLDHTLTIKITINTHFIKEKILLQYSLKI